MARVLMVAYSCEPNSTSEGAVGWELASRIARRHEVHLLTRPKGRDDIEMIRARDRSLALEVEYHELDGLRRMKSLGLPVSNLRYLVWNHRLAHRVADLEREGRFDLVHHTTWVRHWMPSAAAGATHLPFVWGPVGAAERFPISLLRSLTLRATAAEVMRFLGPVALSLDPLMRRTLERVDVAVASSKSTSAHLGSRDVDHVTAPSVGYDPAHQSSSVSDTRNEIVSAGRLLGWKGFHIGMRAFARLDSPGLRYTIVGDGPERSRLADLARELNVSDRVEFTGRLDHEATLERIAGARLLLHPSFHDSGGFVVVEAMAHGTPVVSLDIGGPPFLAGSGGEAVPARPTSTLTERLAAGIEDALAARDSLSEAARRRAEATLAWERIVDVYDDLYREILDGS